MSVKPLTEHHLEFLSLKEGCTGLSESTLVKIPHCWKSDVLAHILFISLFITFFYSSTDSEIWKDFLSKPSLNYILRLLTGIGSGHPPTQVRELKSLKLEQLHATYLI